MKPKTHVRQTPLTPYFRGELMTCVRCGRRQRSDANSSSGWTVIKIDARPGEYWCPDCFTDFLNDPTNPF